MNGHVIPGTPIAVDVWRLKHIQESRLFFLSHAHADHTCGLTSTWKNTIYTSVATSKIIIHKLKIDPNIVKPLLIGEPYLIPIDAAKQEFITVTLFDANHCVGAVIFLFQGYFGTILYTGDFRYYPSLKKDIKQITTASVDYLYLDNTYCNSKCEFRSKEKVMQDLFNIVSCHLEEYDIVIGLRYVGKEDILFEIAKYFQTMIAVDESRLALFKILEFPNYFTTDTQATNIRVVSFEQITRKRVEFWNLKRPTIAILPTCLYVGRENPFREDRNIFVVPYSDHSSFTELEIFVKEIFPKKTVSIVRHQDVAVSVFDSLLNPEPIKKLIIPQTVQNYMTRNNYIDCKNLLVHKRLYNTSWTNNKVKGVVFQKTPEKTDKMSDSGIDIADVNEIYSDDEVIDKKVEDFKLSLGLDILIDSDEDVVIHSSCVSASQSNTITHNNSSLGAKDVICLETDDDESDEKSRINTPDIIIRETPRKEIESGSFKRKISSHPFKRATKKRKQLFKDISDSENDEPIGTVISPRNKHCKVKIRDYLTLHPPSYSTDCSNYTNIDELQVKNENPPKEITIVGDKPERRNLNTECEENENVEMFMFGKREFDAVKLAIFRNMKLYTKVGDNDDESDISLVETQQKIIEERKKRIEMLEEEGKYSEAADLHILLDWQLKQQIFL